MISEPEEKAMSATTASHRFPLTHLLSVDQMSTSMIREIFDVADKMTAALEIPARLSTLTGRVVALLFFEPSSRTILSFHAAATRLGAGVIVHQSAEASSLSKGESLEDTVRVVSGYADMMVLRHESAGAAKRAAAVSTIPLINGGDGSNEHPTQALVDLFTIWRERGSLEGLRVGVGFDPLHSRSIHSLCRALSKFPDNEIILVGPQELWLGDEDVNAFVARGLAIRQSDRLEDLLDCEVVYVNRFQLERIGDPEAARSYQTTYQLRASDLIGSKVQMILDPLPRTHEIAIDVDSLPQALYFRQAGYGVPVRMSLLALLSEGTGD
jgi:aspartate carbamoyltransferase catalytic subunit